MPKMPLATGPARSTMATPIFTVVGVTPCADSGAVPQSACEESAPGGTAPGAPEPGAGEAPGLGSPTATPWDCRPAGPVTDVPVPAGPDPPRSAAPPDPVAEPGDGCPGELVAANPLDDEAPPLCASVHPRS